MAEDRFEGLLGSYLLGELTVEEELELERHLEECRGCFSRAEFEKKLKSHVRDAASTRAPERLRSRIRALIRKF